MDSCCSATALYDESCSSTLASTFSNGRSANPEAGVATTDLYGSCTLKHSRTSAAAPEAAGVFGKPALTWRDIQHLTVLTSKRNRLRDPTGRHGWHVNGAGLEFNHLFGFGMLDASAMVVMAKNWTEGPPRFVTSSALKDHETRHADEKPFSCETCGQSFPRRKALKRHQMIHSGLKPFECRHCHKAFAQKGNLNIHEKLHTEERPYQCLYCDMDFVQKNHMIWHERRHTGEKPFRCSVCSLSCFSRQDLNVHQKIHDGIKYRCGLCEKQLSRKHRLNHHQKKAHDDVRTKTE